MVKPVKSSFSLVAWARGSLPQPNGSAIIAKGTGAGGEQYAIDVNASMFRFYVRAATGGSINLVTPVAPSGRWQHLTATYDGALGTMQFYVNGQLAASGAGLQLPGLSRRLQ